MSALSIRIRVFELGEWDRIVALGDPLTGMEYRPIGVSSWRASSVYAFALSPLEIPRPPEPTELL